MVAGPSVPGPCLGSITACLLLVSVHKSANRLFMGGTV